MTSSFQLKDLINWAKSPHSKLFYNCKAPWDVLNNLPQYIESHEKQILSPIPENVFIENIDQIYLGENVVIEPFCMIKGPCIIDHDAHLGHGSLIRPYSIVSSRARIGHASEVKASIICEGAHLPHFNYVGDSIIGFDCNLGAGSICANVRLDRQVIFSRIAGEKCKTLRFKFGAVIGDHSSIGCNVVLNPGTILPPHSLIYTKQSLEGLC